MPDLIGKTLGGYRIIKQVGLGGMTTVFKAFQPLMDRYVALKIISTHLTQDPTFVKRFRQETKVIAKLEHLHILPVHDYGEEDGYLYLVMRFIEAGTLKDRLKDAPFSLEEARRVVNQIGSALEYAHQLGVVHRDLKPSNILMDIQGDCYLTDFGIAKMVEGTLELTGSSVLGTPHYMAPEQSQSLKVDHRADIYAMGIVIYEMVVGQLPFDADTPFAVLMKHVSEPLPLPRKVKPDLPESIERVILKALAKDPADRYQSMRDLVVDFDHAMQTAPAEVVTGLPASETSTPSIVNERQVEPATVVPPLAPIPAWRRWIAAQPPWLLAAAGLALVVLVLAGMILSRIPGRVEVSGGQVQVMLSTVTAAPTTEEVSVAATSPQLATASATSPPTPRPTATPTPSVTSTPQPTATLFPNPMADQARTFAEPILAAIADRPPDYWDDFSDPASGWERGAFVADGWEQGERGYVDGEYFVSAVPVKLRPQEPDRPPTCASGMPSGLRHFSDMVFEIEGRFVEVQDGDWQVQFHRPSSEADNTYTVSFGPEGAGNVFSYVNMWGYVHGEKWGNDLYMRGFPVRMGLETNRLQIVAAGPQIALYVNGEPALFTTDTNFDERYASGEFSLVICNFADTPLEVRWDNLKIWNISDLPLSSAETATSTLQPTPTPTPNPMAEQSRTFAEPILAAIADRSPDFEDDFSDLRSGWDHGTIVDPSGWEEGEHGYVDGEYYVIASPARLRPEKPGQPMTCAGGGPTDLVSLSDMVLEVEGRFVEIEDGNWHINFRMWHDPATEADGKYDVLFEPRGFVRIGKRHFAEGQEGHWTLAEKQGPPVQAGFELNRLLIVAVGPQIAVYVNGEPVLFATDPNFNERYQSGSFDLTVCNLGDTPLETRWDNLRIWDISDLSLSLAEAATPTPQPTATPTPDPMAEQARAFAEPIVAAVADRPSDYEDDFSDPTSGWEIGTVAGAGEINGTQFEGERGYVAGEYFIRVPRPENDIFCVGVWDESTPPTFSDFVLEVDGRFVSEGQASGWQIFFRHWEEFHRLLVAPDTQADLSRWREQQMFVLAEHTGTPVNGGSETNHIQIIARGSEIAVYANGKAFLYGNDEGYAEPSWMNPISLNVCTHNEVTEVRWDNLRIWDISGLP